MWSASRPDEFVAVLAAKVCVGRIAEDDEDGTTFLDGSGFVGFPAQDGQRTKLLRDVLDIFDRVGEVDVEALAGMELVGPSGAKEFGQVSRAEFEADFEMRHGVRRHEQLETEEPGQQVLMHVGGPKPGLVFLLEALADVFDDLKQERAGAGGGVENQNAVGFLLDLLSVLLARESNFGFVRQTVFEAELLPQQPVNAFNDVRHHRLGRVINAAQFAEFRVVGGEEGFVEVNHRIAPPARADAAPEIFSLAPMLAAASA